MPNGILTIMWCAKESESRQKNIDEIGAVIRQMCVRWRGAAALLRFQYLFYAKFEKLEYV